MQLRTRMLKAQCGDCAYTVRVARKWLAEYGPPLCPCNSQPMESDYAAELEAEACETMEALEVGSATLRDRWVEIRKPISAFVRGKYSPSLEVAFRIANILCTSIDGVFFSMS